MTPLSPRVGAIIKDAIGFLCLGLLAVAGWFIQDWHVKARHYDEAKQETRDVRADFVVYQTQVTHERETIAKADKGYLDEISGLRSDLRTLPAPVVRVCNPTPTAAPAPARDAVPSSATPTSGVLRAEIPVDTQPADIGLPLLSLIREADDLLADYRRVLASLE